MPPSRVRHAIGPASAVILLRHGHCDFCLEERQILRGTAGIFLCLPFVFPSSQTSYPILIYVIYMLAWALLLLPLACVVFRPFRSGWGSMLWLTAWCPSLHCMPI